MEDLELAIQGNKEAFERLINSIKIQLYKTGMSILKDDDDVCDAIQETLISIYKNINTIQNKENFKTWSIRILMNKCYDIIRQNRKIIDINEKVEKNQDLYYEIYINESGLERVLNKIDEDLKIVVVLYYYDDIPVSQISEILNIPEGTVKSRLSRARNKIYEILKKEEGEY